jgi:hypothetical protein
MRPPLEYLFPPGIGAELIYSFVIIFCSLMIYYATKDMYEISAYKGIKYFRQAFLFSAVAYFFRYSIKFFLIFFDIKGIMEISPQFVGLISLFVFLYSSSMAIFYLLYSIMWKKWNHSKLIAYLLNGVALAIALIVTVFGQVGTYLILNAGILVFAIIILLIAYADYKNKPKKNNLFIIYLLLFVFWVLNVAEILIPTFLQLYQLIIYLASISIFMIILYKVLKKVGN